METLLHILLIWFAISIPFSLFVGRLLAMSKSPVEEEEETLLDLEQKAVLPKLNRNIRRMQITRQREPESGA